MTALSTITQRNQELQMNNKSTFRPLPPALAALIGSAFATAALAVDNPLNSIAGGVANWATQSTQQYVQDKVQEEVTQTVQSVVPGGTPQEPAPGAPAKPWVEPSRVRCADHAGLLDAMGVVL